MEKSKFKPNDMTCGGCAWRTDALGVSSGTHVFGNGFGRSPQNTGEGDTPAYFSASATTGEQIMDKFMMGVAVAAVRAVAPKFKNRKADFVSESVG